MQNTSNFTWHITFYYFASVFDDPTFILHINIGQFNWHSSAIGQLPKQVLPSRDFLSAALLIWFVTRINIYFTPHFYVCSGQEADNAYLNLTPHCKTGQFAPQVAVEHFPTQAALVVLVWLSTRIFIWFSPRIISL